LRQLSEYRHTATAVSILGRLYMVGYIR